jgi:hypothetical protein
LQSEDSAPESTSGASGKFFICLLFEILPTYDLLGPFLKCVH